MNLVNILKDIEEIDPEFQDRTNPRRAAIKNMTGFGTKVALYGGDVPHNLYEEMKEVFSEWWIVALYLAGVIALFWHLFHGFQSAFQTFGINHKRYTPIIKVLGAAFSIIIPLVFALMPVAMYMEWIN